MDGPVAQFLFNLEEIEALENAVASSIAGLNGILTLAKSRGIRDATRSRVVVLNSLRTSLAEARYGIERVME